MRRIPTIEGLIMSNNSPKYIYSEKFRAKYKNFKWINDIVGREAAPKWCYHGGKDYLSIVYRIGLNDGYIAIITDQRDVHATAPLFFKVLGGSLQPVQNVCEEFVEALHRGETFDLTKLDNEQFSMPDFILENEKARQAIIARDAARQQAKDAAEYAKKQERAELKRQARLARQRSRSPAKHHIDPDIWSVYTPLGTRKPIKEE